MRLAIAALSGALVCGCAHVSPPERGGAPWFRLGSEHFVLLTDLPRDRAEGSLREFEQRRAAILAAGWDGWPEPPGRVEIIELRGSSELADFGPGLDLSGFALPGPFGQLSLVIADEDATNRARAIQYLLAAQIALAQLRRAPPWLVLGFSEYLSTLRIDEARGLAVFGEPAADLLAAAGSPRQWRGGAGASGAYAFFRSRSAAWERVHYLFTERNAQFNEFLNRLRRGEQPRRAFQAAFPGLESHLAESVRDYARTILYSKSVKVGTVPLPALDGVVTTATPVPPAEVHAIFARLYVAGPSGNSASQRQRADAELQEALRLDPDSVSALALGPLARMEPSRRLERLRTLVAAHPDDHRAWLLLGLAEPGHSAAREQALRRAIAIAPEDPILLATLSEELRDRDPAEALRFASRAALLAPWLEAPLAAEAAAFAAVGRCDDAVLARDRLLDRFEHGGSLSETVRQAVGDISRACPGASPHASGSVDARPGG